MRLFKRKKVVVIIKRANYVWGKQRKRVAGTPWVRWQEEEKFLNFNSSFLFSMKENNPQTNERNIYKEKLDILD